MNLPYSAKSTETGTAGNTVSSALRERLNSSTVYYYTVSAVSGDITVEMRRTLITPLYSKLHFLFLGITFYFVEFISFWSKSMLFGLIF